MPVATPPARRSALGTLAWIGSTYLGQGLPWSVLHQVAAELFTAAGLPRHVGYLSALHWGSAAKFVISPFVEFYGTLRGWLIATQLVMAVLVGLLGVLAERMAASAQSPAAATWPLWPVLLAICLGSATYDIACDGYYLRRLGRVEQARYSGTRVMAFRVAMLLGSSGLVILAGRRGWAWGFGAGALLLLLLALGHALWLPRLEKGAHAASSSDAPEAPRPLSATRDATLAVHARHAYKTFFAQERALWVVAFLLSYKMADILMFSMSRVLMADELGIPTDVRGMLNSFGVWASILGAVSGGAWIAKKTLRATLFPLTLIMALPVPFFALLAAYAPELQVSKPHTAATLSDLDWQLAWPRLTLIGLVLVVEQFCGGLATAAQAVFIMRRCSPQHFAAHAGFATATYSLSQGLVGVASGHLYQGVGPTNFFLLASLLTLPALLVARRVPTD